jgi:uncharacterized protein (TIGR03435 family)
MRLVQVLVAGTLSCGWMGAQAVPAFDVATVKATDPSFSRKVVRIRPGEDTLTISGMSLRDLLEFAYDLPASFVDGGPAWVSTDRFDISAKSERIPPPSQEERREMLKALLKERFQLSFHYERKRMDVYTLTVVPAGHKMRPRTNGDGGAAYALRMTQANNYPGRNASMDALAYFFRSVLGRQVVDQTNLSGSFDFDLAFAPTEPDFVPTNDSDSRLPNLFTAVQDQLGLKLLAEKVLSNVLTIDSAAKPSGN